MKELIGLKLKKSDGVSSTIYVGEIELVNEKFYKISNPMRIVEFAYYSQEPILTENGDPIYKMTSVKDEKGEIVKVPTKQQLIKNMLNFDVSVGDEVFCGNGTTMKILVNTVAMEVIVTEENTPYLFAAYNKYMSESSINLESAKSNKKSIIPMKKNIKRVERRGNA